LARTRKLIRRTLAWLALGLAGTAVAPAGALATITVGSDLSLPTPSISNNCILSTPPCTHVLFAVHAGNAFPRTSPTDGTIVSFGMKTGVLRGANETATLRVALGSGDTANMTGAGTGPTITVHEPGTYSFPASLPIKAGDYIGIDTSSTRAFAASATCGSPPNSGGYFTYHPVLTDGGPFQTADANSTCELLINAVVAPSSKFSFGKVKRNVKLGIVFLTVEVPGPGKLTLSGRGVAKQARAPQGAVISKSAKAAGPVKLKVKPKGAAKGKLNATGRATVRVKVTFAPIGGDPSTQSVKVKLGKKL
jgi:hypothetical protein